MSEAWFWILIGFGGGIAALGALCLIVFAFANWRRKVVVSTKNDG